jgi:hypothetical protein
VRMGMSVADLLITATRIPVGNQSTFIGRSAPDESGRYEIDVPAGRYWVAIEVGDRSYYSYSRTGMKIEGEEADTLLVDEEHSYTDVDFSLAVVRVQLTAPAVLNGEYGKVTLHRRGDPRPPNPWGPVNLGGGVFRNGHLEIVVPCVIPGSYKMEMEVAYRVCMCSDIVYDGEHFWLPAERDSSQVDWVDVPMGQITEAAGSIEPSPARIEGEVVGAWPELQLIERPEISLISLDSTLVMGPRSVEETGRFGLNVYLPCPVKVNIMQEGIEQWMGGRSFAEAGTFALEHGQLVSAGRFVGSGVAVHVSPDSLEFGLAGASVHLYEATSGIEVGPLNPTLRLGWQEEFGIPNLRPGAYLLWIDRDSWDWGDWLPQWFDRSPTREGAQVITIANEGDVVPVEVTLEMGGRIEATIVDTGHPGAGYLACFTSAADPAAQGVAFVREGVFSIHGLVDGDYKIGAWRETSSEYPDQPPPGTIWYPGTADWSAAATIAIRDHAAVSGLTIVMPN